MGNRSRGGRTRTRTGLGGEIAHSESCLSSDWNPYELQTLSVQVRSSSLRIDPIHAELLLLESLGLSSNGLPEGPGLAVSEDNFRVILH